MEAVRLPASAGPREGQESQGARRGPGPTPVPYLWPSDPSETTIPLTHQRIEDNCPERLFGKHEQAKPDVNRGRNEQESQGARRGPGPLSYLMVI